jgi:hypothetical protein
MLARTDVRGYDHPVLAAGAAAYRNALKTLVACRV